jgi:hypothetical protein
MRRLLLAATILVLAPAAGAAASGGPLPPVQGGVGASAPGAPAHYVAIALRGRQTLVEKLVGGKVERYRVIPGSWGVAAVGFDGSTTGLSADMRRLVLAGTDTRYPPRSTRFAFLSPGGLRLRGVVRLAGWNTLDAISPDGRWLYLIHYRSNGVNYEVRAYDVTHRRMLARPIVDPREPDEKMQGIAATRTMSPDGRWAYTLYMRGDEAPFIHALDTTGRTARCIDLPARYAATDLSGFRLRLHGGTLAVQDTGTTVVRLDTRTWRAVAPHRAAKAPARPAPDDGGSNAWAWALAGLPLLGLVALVTRRRMRPGVSSPA